MRYVHGLPMSKLWCTAQVLPAVRPYTQQPLHGTSGGVPHLECQCQDYKNPKKERGWRLLDLEAQCRALLCRMYVQSKKEGTMTATWKESWGFAERQPNPPNANRTLEHFVYLYNYATDMAYIMSPEQNESLHVFLKRTYTTLHTIALATKEIRDMGVVQLHRQPLDQGMAQPSCRLGF